MQRSITIAYVIVFSALAIILTFSRAEVPYPLLPYLKFDFAEVPVMLALLLGGLTPGLVTGVIHWIGLSIARGWVLGPLMKFLAVVPMVFGFWLGMKIWRGKRAMKVIVVALLAGIVLRIVVCAVTNTVVFLFVAPEFLKFSAICLRTLGINVASELEVLSWTLIFNAIFNAFHVILSSMMAILVFRATTKVIPSIAERAWASSRTK